jgi:hypothetical protein
MDWVKVISTIYMMLLTFAYAMGSNRQLNTPETIGSCAGFFGALTMYGRVMGWF